MLKFLIFNLPKVTSHDTRFTWKRLLRSAMKKSKKELRLLRNDVFVYEQDFEKILSSINITNLVNGINKNVYRTAIKTMRSQEKKLGNLTKSVTLPFIDTETIHYLTNYYLQTHE